MTLGALTVPVQKGDRFTLAVPDGWQQGRGTFGGLVLSALVRACEAFESAPERTLRSMSGHICGPVVVGEAEITVARVRSGTGVSTLAATLKQGSETLVHAVCLFGKQRVTDADWLTLQPPQLPAWSTIEPLGIGPPFGPVFSQHLEYRSTGALPFSGDAGETLGYLRERRPGPARDAAMLVALIDAWWPVAVSRMTTPRPMGTIAFTAQITGDLALVPVDEPLVHRARANVSRDGYSLEERELWSLDGRLLALNQQTVALIK